MIILDSFDTHCPRRVNQMEAMCAIEKQWETHATLVINFIPLIMMIMHSLVYWSNIGLYQVTHKSTSSVQD
jgi:hypothetical protein